MIEVISSVAFTFALLLSLGDAVYRNFLAAMGLATSTGIREIPFLSNFGHHGKTLKHSIGDRLKLTYII